MSHHHGLNSRVSGSDHRDSKGAHITNSQIGLLKRVVQPVGFNEIWGMLQFSTISFASFGRDPQAGERWARSTIPPPYDSGVGPAFQPTTSQLATAEKASGSAPSARKAVLRRSRPSRLIHPKAIACSIHAPSSQRRACSSYAACFSAGVPAET